MSNKILLTFGICIIFALPFANAVDENTTLSTPHSSSPSTAVTTTQVPIAKNPICQNATETIHKCFEDFASYYKFNKSLINDSLVNKVYSINCNVSMAFNQEHGEGINKSACLSVNKLLLSNVTFNYALLCNLEGLEVIPVSSFNHSKTFLERCKEMNDVFCGMTSSLTCKNRTSDGLLASSDVLKPLNDKCFPITTPYVIPLLPNPVSPDGITAIVVIICLTIIVILAGFFFWPKCHNPKAGWFPKKKSKYSADIKPVEYPSSTMAKPENSVA